MATATALRLSGDVIADNFEFPWKDRTFLLRKEGTTVRVYEEATTQAVGSIHPGGPSSGSIWTNGDCIGEYYLEEGKYVVVPIEDGFRQVEAKVAKHPVEFLLSLAIK